MAEPEYEVRAMTAADVPKALQVWKETGMQEGTHCLYTWLKVDPQGFHIAVTKTGEVLAVCSAILHNKDLAFVGIYSVLKKFRGLGIGYKVWNACMDHIGERNAALNAVPGKLELYRDKGGFPIVETEWVCLVNETENNVDPCVLADESPAGVEIRPLEEADLPLVLEYDFKLIGYKRDVALKGNFREDESSSFVAIRDGACVGFGTVKRSVQEAAQVGPLYADDPRTAEVLLRKLIESRKEKGLAIMTVSNNPAANAIVAKLKVPMAEECPRLYKRDILRVDCSKVYAQFDLNFSPF